MAIIFPEGLFYGERLSKCSDLARLYYPWLFVAANGYARLEISPARIVATVFSSFREKPSEEAIVEVLAEYQENYLLFLYSKAGQLWGQFICPKKCLKQHPTALDESSPEPPAEELAAFVEEYEKKKETAKSESVSKLRALIIPPESRANSIVKPYAIDEKRPRGVGVGVGQGVGVGGGKTKASAPQGGLAFLPDWVPVETWRDFIAMRKTLRKPPTNEAIRLIVLELDKLRSKGHDPKIVLEQSIRNSWQDVFPIKGEFGKPQENRTVRDISKILKEQE